MAAGYLLACSEQLPLARVVIDKFHVMQYVYDAVLDVRRRIKKELSSGLTRGKVKTPHDKEVLFQLDLLGQTGYRLTQPAHKWSDAGRELMNTVFCGHPQLKAAYDLAQEFRQWYAVENISRKDRPSTAADLHQWYGKVVGSGLDEFRSALKMIRKHEDEVINYFICGQTSAKAERINGKINRFISNNYGIKDKDFALYRTALYFS
jgi:transposase